MARFNIALRTEDRVWDTLHTEHEDVTALRVEVARFVGELLRDHAHQIWEDKDWRIDVTDESGLILYVMSVSATDTPGNVVTPAS